MRINATVDKGELIKHIRNFCLECTDGKEGVRRCSGSTYNGDICSLHEYRLFSYRKAGVDIPTKETLKTAIEDICVYCLQGKKFSKLEDCFSGACYLKTHNVVT